MTHLKQNIITQKDWKYVDAEKLYEANTNQNKTGIAILISVKIIFIMDEHYYR